VLYDAVAQWEARQQLTVDEISLPFFVDIYPSVTQGVYGAGNEESPFVQIMRAVTTYADGFMAITQQYIPSNGSIGEQYLRNNGTPASAYALTWSFASFITAASRRDGIYPESWGVGNAAPVPGTCSGATVQGTYVPAVAAGAPNNTDYCTVSTTFVVNASTNYVCQALSLKAIS
jgi:glucoamylase